LQLVGISAYLSTFFRKQKTRKIQLQQVTELVPQLQEQDSVDIFLLQGVPLYFNKVIE
jgi:hypothetical protein